MLASFIALIVTLVVVTIVWRIHVHIGDATILDGYWGVGFGVIALVCGLASLPLSFPQWALLTAVWVWGIRLSVHLLMRHHQLGTEDRRYAAMREKHGDAWHWRSLWMVFGLQGLLMWIMSLPLQLSMLVPAEDVSHWAVAIGAVLFILGFSIEWRADIELARFKANPSNSGKTLRSGLWAWSRHPNYFGEIMLWWGLGLWSFGIIGLPFAWIGFLAPAMITLFLVKVSGIALVEPHMSASRDDYSDYKANTPALWPRPPRRS